MDKQMSLSALSDELAQMRTKKKEFLAQIDRIIPWGEWIALIANQKKMLLSAWTTISMCGPKSTSPPIFSIRPSSL